MSSKYIRDEESVMDYRRYYFIVAIIILTAVLPPLPLYARSHEEHASTAGAASSAAKADQTPAFMNMPAPGEKVSIGSDYYIIYGFDKKPKMGTAILKVTVYTKKGEKDTSLLVEADSGMPSMRGAHDTGDRPMQISKNKDYLIPISIVMPGDWEIRITIKKDDKVIYRGRYGFDV
jgi:hypothetical protein